MDIRNFVIISHIDHGKSTLADRFLELTATVDLRQMKPQYLDQLELERERGITIKMAPVRMMYTLNNLSYVLNLIDTPGHSDFSYEVSRALAAVEGAILLVDVTKGVQAQTLANFEAAKKTGLKIIGAVNKIDLKSPQLENIIEETADLIGSSKEEIFGISGKTGEGVKELLEAVIRYLPPPKAPAVLFEESVSEPERARFLSRAEGEQGRESRGEFLAGERDPVFPKINPLTRALIFDSFYDEHKGVILTVRLFNGEINIEDEVYFIASEEQAKIKEVGYFVPELKPAKKLSCGEIGYLVTGIKDPEKFKIGDTVILNPKSEIKNSKLLALPGYKEPQPVVFVSFYPEDGDQYEDLKKSFQKLKLNDSALKFQGDSNEVFGRGFKVGFLGKLHFEITAERLEKEFGIKTVNTFPSVAYKIPNKLDFTVIENPHDLPNDFKEIWEPMIKLEIIAPIFYLGNILQLKDKYRFSNIETKNFGGFQEAGEKILIVVKMPLAELISDFDSQLKSMTNGFASYSYKITEFEKADLAKLEILVAAKPVPGLIRIIPRYRIVEEARQMAERLKNLLPRQQFAQAIQAVSCGKIIARETIPALKKDVTGYLYGGDRTRKMKLWQKQKKGKKKLLQMTSGVRIPVKIFKDLLR